MRKSDVVASLSSQFYVPRLRYYLWPVNFRCWITTGLAKRPELEMAVVQGVN